MKNKCIAKTCSILEIKEPTFKSWLKKTMKKFIHYKNVRNLSISMLRFLIWDY